MDLRAEAMEIIENSIKEVLPDFAVKKALENKEFIGKIVVVAIGKAAYNMAKASKEILGDKIYKGIIITKYDHAKGNIDGFEIIEAAHPVPDKNAIVGSQKAIKMVESLTENDTVVFLVSGGGSSLFELPLNDISLEEIMQLTNDLLACGADIVEINTIRKHLSAVKGGRFAKFCAPAKVFSIVLSDVIGDRLDSIASGPCHPDGSTSLEALAILQKYNIKVSKKILDTLEIETPKELLGVETKITGSVTKLCEAVARVSESIGYNPYILSSTLECEAKEAGKFIASLVKEVRQNNGKYFNLPCAIIIGGETTVRLQGNGVGGRNQEIALASAVSLKNEKDFILFSLGSDGTDGPTDAAGGIIDGKTYERIFEETGVLAEVFLDNNDSYNALKASKDLIITGSTGTNVNDVIVALIK